MMSTIVARRGSCVEIRSMAMLIVRRVARADWSVTTLQSENATDFDTFWNYVQKLTNSLTGIRALDTLSSFYP